VGSDVGIGDGDNVRSNHACTTEVWHSYIRQAHDATNVAAEMNRNIVGRWPARCECCRFGGTPCGVIEGLLGRKACTGAVL